MLLIKINEITKQLMKGADMKMDNKIIGNRINELLAKNNMLQKELAKQLNVSDNVISYWCCGSRKPSIEQIIQIAKLFNCSTDYLLGVSNVATSDKDIQFICDYTGLDEEAVENLHDCTYVTDEIRRIAPPEYLYERENYIKRLSNLINCDLLDTLVNYDNEIEYIDNQTLLYLSLFYYDFDVFKDNSLLYSNFLDSTLYFTAHYENNNDENYNCISFTDKKDLILFRAQKDVNAYLDNKERLLSQIYSNGNNCVRFFDFLIECVNHAVDCATNLENNDEKAAIAVYKQVITECMNDLKDESLYSKSLTDGAIKLKAIYDEYLAAHYNLKKKGDSNAE